MMDSMSQPNEDYTIAAARQTMKFFCSRPTTEANMRARKSMQPGSRPIQNNSYANGILRRSTHQKNQ